jgi:nucleoid DNA-binding protein
MLIVSLAPLSRPKLRKIKVVLFLELGFGTFSVAARSQREGRNPRTGEKIKIPASKLAMFKAGKTLSEKVK